MSIIGCGSFLKFSIFTYICRRYVTTKAFERKKKDTRITSRMRPWRVCDKSCWLSSKRLHKKSHSDEISCSDRVTLFTFSMSPTINPRAFCRTVRSALVRWGLEKADEQRNWILDRERKLKTDSRMTSWDTSVRCVNERYESSKRWRTAHPWNILLPENFDDLQQCLSLLVDLCNRKMYLLKKLDRDALNYRISYSNGLFRIYQWKESGTTLETDYSDRSERARTIQLPSPLPV